MHPGDRALEEIVDLLVETASGRLGPESLDAIQAAAATLSLPRLELGAAFERLGPASTTSVSKAKQIAETLWRNGLRGDVVIDELIRRDPSNAALRTISQRHRHFMPITRAGLKPIVHVAFFVPGAGNLGDRVLPSAVRRVLGFDDRHCVSKHVHQHFSMSEASVLAADTSVVVGGGGLILPDTRANSRSGWQWNIDDQTIREIGRRSRSLVVFAVGVNLFSESEPLSARATGSLTTLAEHATMIGLRERGGIDRLRDVLPASLHDRVVYTPCPTVLGPDYPSISSFPERLSIDTIGVNCAYDRADRRFSDVSAFEQRMAAFCARATKQGQQIRVLAFHARDRRFSQVLVEHGVPHRLDALDSRPLDEVYGILRSVGVVVAMRGHAQMIPFGLGIPFVTIDSHPKTRYFANDAGIGEFVVDADSTSIAEQLHERLAVMQERWTHVRSALERSRSEMVGAIEAASTAFGLESILR